jgi:spermidine synthase
VLVSRARNRRRDVGALGACFFLSGTASLMLEVVWTRLLRLVFGSTTLAVSTILVAYMLGLALGGLAGGRITARLRNGVRGYAWIEIAIGLYAVLVPSILGVFPLLNRAVFSNLTIWAATAGRFTAVLVALIVPTVLMGATLPILVAALVRRRMPLASRVGLLYGLNTLGAVTGVFLSTFVLFPAIGVWRTNLTAAGLDLAIGLLALLALARRFETEESISAAPAAAASAEHGAVRTAPTAWNPAGIVYGLVGFTALVYEVCWTRALSMILGSSVYAFAAMLGAFLMGIAVGSLLLRRWAGRLQRPLVTYAWGIAAVGLLALATRALFGMLPDLFVRAVVGLGLSRAGMVATHVVLSMLVMLGPTLVLGALFPLLTGALAAPSERTSATVGDVYFVNTLGSAAGAFCAGFVLIPAYGLPTTLGLASAANCIAASALLVWQREWTGRARVGGAIALLAAAVVILAIPPRWDRAALTRGVYRDPEGEIGFGLELLPLLGVPDSRILYYRDGINSSVSVHREHGDITLRVNGKADASALGDLPTQGLLAEVPMLFGPPPARVLVIGLGSGITVGSVALRRESRVDVVELEPAVVEASRFFEHVNNRPLEQPNVRLIEEDARTYLASTSERYDVMISEPSNPWMAGASNLFTREFFTAARQAMHPGGRFCQWLQLYEIDPPSLRAIVAAFRSAFPYLYGFAHTVGGPDLLLLGMDRPLGVQDLPVWETLSEPVRDDLRRMNSFSTADLWSLIQLTPADLEAIVRQADTANSDDNMFVELHLPWAVAHPSSADENWKLLDQFRHGALPIVESLDAERLGALAVSYVNPRNDVPSARAVLDTLHRQRAREPSVHALVAQALVMLREGAGAPDQARALLDEAVSTGAEFFAPWYYRGLLHERLNEPEWALADVQAALRVQPGDLRARSLRLRVLTTLQRPAEAVTDAAALLASPYVHADMALWVYAARPTAAAGERNKAIVETMRYLEMNPNWSAGWLDLAALYDGLGQPDQASEARTNAERAKHNEVVALHRAAVRAERLQTPTAAVRLLQSALQLDPHYEPARQELRRLGASQ